MKYYSDNVERQNKLFGWVGHLPYEITFVDYNHFRASEADIVVIDIPIEEVEKRSSQLLVTYPFVLTDLLNAISLILNHRQIAELTAKFPLDLNMEKFHLLQETFQKMNLRHHNQVPSLRVESRVTFGNGGYQDNFNVLQDENVSLFVLLSSPQSTVLNHGRTMIDQVPKNKQFFSNFLESILAGKQSNPIFELSVVYYDEDMEEMSWKSTDSESFCVENDGGLVSLLSYGARKLKQKNNLKIEDSLEFSLQATKENFIHDLTIVNIFKRSEGNRVFKIAS